MTDMEECWITTFTGKLFYPLRPRVEDVDIRDIAHALSNICRFTGHCPKFYSVAQHSVIVSRCVSKENALWGLLHDASEAYISDIARPVKHDPRLSIYTAFELSIMAVVAEKYGLDVHEPQEVKEVDAMVLRNEAKCFGMLTCEWKHYDLPDLDIGILPMEPELAEELFKDRFLELYFGVWSHGAADIQ